MLDLPRIPSRTEILHVLKHLAQEDISPTSLDRVNELITDLRTAALARNDILTPTKAPARELRNKNQRARRRGTMPKPVTLAVGDKVFIPTHQAQTMRNAVSHLRIYAAPAIRNPHYRYTMTQRKDDAGNLLGYDFLRLADIDPTQVPARKPKPKPAKPKLTPQATEQELLEEMERRMYGD